MVKFASKQLFSSYRSAPYWMFLQWFCTMNYRHHTHHIYPFWLWNWAHDHIQLALEKERFRMKLDKYENKIEFTGLQMKTILPAMASDSTFILYFSNILLSYNNHNHPPIRTWKVSMFQAMWSAKQYSTLGDKWDRIGRWTPGATEKITQRLLCLVEMGSSCNNNRWVWVIKR